jgi:hypothetical protein
MGTSTPPIAFLTVTDYSFFFRILRRTARLPSSPLN